MTYKTQLLYLVQHFLLQTHSFEEVQEMLGHWNDPSFKAQRNTNISDAVKGIVELIDRSKP